ncbi:MAG TPA: hypothetical protein QF870_06390, partial [Nitrospinota bacterium]|nr:hypothetical protein [Nitrospinota bacterium]
MFEPEGPGGIGNRRLSHRGDGLDRSGIQPGEKDLQIDLRGLKRHLSQLEVQINHGDDMGPDGVGLSGIVHPNNPRESLIERPVQAVDQWAGVQVVARGGGPPGAGDAPVFLEVFNAVFRILGCHDREGE